MDNVRLQKMFVFCFILKSCFAFNKSNEQKKHFFMLIHTICMLFKGRLGFYCEVELFIEVFFSILEYHSSVAKCFSFLNNTGG